MLWGWNSSATPILALMKCANDVSAARANSRKDSRVTNLLDRFTWTSYHGNHLMLCDSMSPPNIS
jgi:hypothetical protein